MSLCYGAKIALAEGQTVFEFSNNIIVYIENNELFKGINCTNAHHANSVVFSDDATVTVYHNNKLIKTEQMQSPDKIVELLYKIIHMYPSDYESLVIDHLPDDIEMIIIESIEDVTLDDVVDHIWRRIADFHDHCLRILALPPSNTITWDDDDISYNRYIGNLMSWVPSGKYYTPWTTNQTPLDEMMDRIFWDVVCELLPDAEFSRFDGDGIDLIITTFGGDT